MSDVDARYLGLTANQLAKIATDLKAENAELRDEIDHLLIKRQYTEDVNAKLRELALTLAHCAAGHGCDMCPLNGKEGIVNALDMCDGIHDHMRQLGVVK